MVGTPLLATQGLEAGHGGMAVVHGFDLELSPGEIVVLLGPNGAGKTTTLLTLAGDLAPIHGQVFMDGHLAPRSLHGRARRGLRLITEERSVMMSMTVADNLRLAHKNIAPCLELFPELQPLLNRRAGLLSGGEQQMLTLARAVVGDGRILLADELSLGLAPSSSAGFSEPSAPRPTAAWAWSWWSNRPGWPWKSPTADSSCAKVWSSSPGLPPSPGRTWQRSSRATSRPFSESSLIPPHQLPNPEEKASYRNGQG